MPKKAMKKRAEEEYQTIMVRKVSSRHWEAMRDLAEQRGLKLWAVMNEMLEDWVRKHTNER